MVLQNYEEGLGFRTEGFPWHCMGLKDEKSNVWFGSMTLWGEQTNLAKMLGKWD